MKTGPIPTMGVYRGCGLHDQQSPARLAVVRADIDEAFSFIGIRELSTFVRNAGKAPEARLAAAELIRNRWRLAAADRRVRPAVDMDELDAEVGGLSVESWRDPDRYGTLLDHGAVRREVPLDDSVPAA